MKSYLIIAACFVCFLIAVGIFSRIVRSDPAARARLQQQEAWR